MIIKKIEILKFMFFLNFFLPTWNSILSPTGTDGFIILNFLLISFLLGQIFLFYNFKMPKLNFLSKIFLILLLLLFFQILLSSILYDSVAFSDVFELIRPVFYFSSFILGYMVLSKNLASLEELIEIVVRFTLLSIIFGFLCLLFKSGFGGSIISLYVKDSLINSSRFVGTFMNPYDFAILFSMAFSYYFIAYIKDGKISSVLSISALMVALALSQSKNVFATFIYSFFIVSLLYNFFVDDDYVKKRVVSNARILLVFFLILSFSVFVYLNFKMELSYLVNGIRKIMEGSSDKSTSIRVQQFAFLIDILVNQPTNLILGHGARKNTGLMFESLYSLYIFRYGILGIVLILFYSLVPSYFLAFELKKNQIKPTSALVLLVFFSSVLIAGVGNNIVDQARISLPFFLILGAVFGTVSIKTRLRKEVNE